jgi:hypothetical protein
MYQQGWVRQECTVLYNKKKLLFALTRRRKSLSMIE